jgi:hypothetical protein
MSLALNPLQPVRVCDPRIDFSGPEHHRMYGVTSGGQQVSWKPYTSTSFSNSAWNFSCPPPSPLICVDPKFYVSVPVNVSFTGTTTNPSGVLLNNGFDGFRAFPLANIIQTLTVRMNNSAASINMADVIPALLRYNTTHNIKEYDYSLCPTMQDYMQNYSDMAGTNRNPLSFYSSNSYETTRGAFPYVSVNNGSTTASVSATITEPIFLSPFLFGKGSDSKNGFIGVQTLDFQFVLGNTSRIWSHDNSGGTTFSAVTVSFGQPSILFSYITPKMLQEIPKSLSYSYMVIDRYPTDKGSTIGPGATCTISSNNIQLNSIPKRVYLYAKKKNEDLTYLDTDTFFALNRITVQYNNQSGLLSSASAQDLYNISKRNGVNMSWPEWSGSAFTSGGTTLGLQTQQGVPVLFDSTGPNGCRPKGLIGSVLALDFGIQIGLDDLHAPGEIFTSQFQVTCDFTNINQTQSINPTLYLVFVSEGIWTIENLQSIAQIGVLNKEDILNARQIPGVNIRFSDNVYGGDFLKSLKNVGNQVLAATKKAAPYIKQGVNAVGKAAHLASKGIETAEALGPLLGLGMNGQKRKRNMRGGELITREELRNRIGY